MSSMIYLVLHYPNPRIAPKLSETAKQGYCYLELHDTKETLWTRCIEISVSSIASHPLLLIFFFVITSAQRTMTLTMRPLRHKKTVFQMLFWLQSLKCCSV